MSEILIVCGGHRANGNSYAAAKALEKKYLKENTHTVHFVNLRETNIKHCLADDCCSNEFLKTCVLKDDMNALYPLINRADILVMVSPLYFFSVSSKMKTFIDRCQFIWAERFVHKRFVPKEGKKGYFVSVGASKTEKLYEGVDILAKFFFRSVGIDDYKLFHVKGVEKKGDFNEASFEKEVLFFI